MSNLPSSPVSRNPSNPPSERELIARSIAAQHFAGPNQDQFEQLVHTLLRLHRDGNDRGDIKLLSRALGELRYAFKVFNPFSATRKISIFGSSRTKPEHPDYIAAMEYAKRMCAAGWMVITGAGDGIMKAGHGGAGREASFGVAIRLPFEQATNDIIADDDKLVNFNYFFTRKLMFIKEASAVALFPGGFGTQDELFETLTLIQTGKAQIVPVVMVEHANGRYWKEWQDYVDDHLLKTGMISGDDEHLYLITDDIQEAVDEVLRFYRVHHSHRYVGKDLVMRLETKLSPTALQKLNDEFANSLLVSGKIEACEALPEEDGEFAEKPRLRFHFNKRNFGLLRKFIDRVNESA